jgi:Na+/pantothenate symporter
MSRLDLAIVVASLVGLVVFAGWLAGRQRRTTDYYLGGGRLPAWALGLSLAANQVSAISLVGAPAFVALRPGGGLAWLQYEMAVPLAVACLVLWGFRCCAGRVVPRCTPPSNDDSAAEHAAPSPDSSWWGGASARV